MRQCWGMHRAGRSQPDPCGEEGQGREWLRCQRTLLLLGEWEAEPGNGGQDVLGALVSLESPGVLQAALSQPCALVTPVSWCSLHSSAQQPLLQVHLTWFWENLASEMVPHFPSPHPRPLLWVQGGKVPVGHGSGGAPARSGLVRQVQVTGCAGGETEAGAAGSHWPVVFFGNLQFPS